MLKNKTSSKNSRNNHEERIAKKLALASYSEKIKAKPQLRLLICAFKKQAKVYRIRMRREGKPLGTVRQMVEYMINNHPRRNELMDAWKRDYR